MPDSARDLPSTQVQPDRDATAEQFPRPADTHSGGNSTLAQPLPAVDAADTPTLSGGPKIAGFDVVAELGRGGMGVVYRAFDRKRSRVVALKTMRTADAAALLRFKQEFRALADVRHPNLVSLHELIADGTQWCFTMEYIDGDDFRTYVTGRPPIDETDSANPGRHDRLRSALRQLSGGLSALHAAGMVHRDVKPSNVIVSRDGRVVLLDFGLIAHTDPTDPEASTLGNLRGTLAYMSPEQARGGALGPATDWYSVGVMLFEALTGRLPYQSSGWAMLQEKERDDAPPPDSLAAGVPADLNALCVALLRRDPSQRPIGAEVLKQLGGAAPPIPVPATSALVGRAEHLAALADAFVTSRHGQPVVCHVRGRSGAGKTALVKEFVGGLHANGAAVVLTGQCYEQEAVPYKAFDGLVDSLTRYLARLPDADARSVLPRDLVPLVRVFPVLARAPAVAAAQRPTDIPDPLEQRRRAFLGLRELLARLGDARPLVLWIDDVQWGDADSVDLLAAVLRPPDPPTLLLVLGARSDEDGPILRATFDGVETRTVAVEPLNADAARELARRLLADEPAALAEAVARESGGNPFFLRELARHARAGEMAASRGTLDDMIWLRVERLPVGPRRLVALAATAGRPLPEPGLTAAADLGCEWADTLAALKAQRLLRGTAADAGAGRISCYHDRVREAVAARLPAADTRDAHRRLAAAFADADPEFVADHWAGAGEADRAAECYARAGERAATALAFDRAAVFYALAEEQAPHSPERRSWQRRRADALANARRGAEAGPIYFAAAAGAGAEEAIELRRLAAEQMLWCGQTDDGLAVAADVMRSLGLRLPRSERATIAALLWHRLRIKLRGLRFHERPAADVPRALLQQVDVCWSLGASLSHADLVRGAEVQARHLLLALKAGEAFRVCRALALEAGYACTGGGPAAKRTEQLTALAAELAGRINEPGGLGFTELANGVAAFMQGRWPAARSHLDTAGHIFRERCTGVAWAVNMVALYGLRSLELLGETCQLVERLPAAIRDAELRSDRYAATDLRTRLTYVVALLDDDPRRAAAELSAGIADWSVQGFHQQHYFETTGRVEIAFYTGDAASVTKLLQERWRALRPWMSRVQTNRLTMLGYRARAAVAVRPTGADRRAVENDLRAIERERMPWSAPEATLYRAALAAQDERDAEAIALLKEAESGFAAASMAHHASAARRRRGALTGGDAGRELIAAADSHFTSQRVRNPERYATMIAPGFDR
jgi:tRNA A-37 threonylcarbamoyl transferase component Bud32